MGTWDCNKCTTLVGIADNGEGYACVRAKGIWESLYFPTNFAVNLKLIKKIVLKNKQTNKLTDT